MEFRKKDSYGAITPKTEIGKRKAIHKPMINVTSAAHYP